MNTSKSYDNLAKRIKIQENEETKSLLLDDAINNIQTALEKDGHTGKLSNPDGILRGKPQLYRGFMVQVFGMIRYQSDLDIFGKLYYFGWARKLIKVKGKKAKIEFATETAEPLGFETEHEAGNWLYKIVDLYSNQIN